MQVLPVSTLSPKTLKVDRLSRNLLFNTAYIRHEVAPGRFSTGTSFFYEGLLGGDGTRTMPFLVTNKHVISGATSGTIRLMQAQDDEPKLGSSIEVTFTEDDWVGHPDLAVDIAVVSMSGVMNQLEAQGMPPFYRVLGRDMLPTAEVIDDLDVMEPVVFVGYPNSLYDTVNLTPIMRRGTTATPVQLDYSGTPQFLIDASIFPGSSGSPVFLVNENGYRQGGNFIMGASRILFLGVVAAVHQQSGTGRIVTQTNPTIEFDQMIDLGLVFKWTAVEETIEEWFRKMDVNRTTATALTAGGEAAALLDAAP